MIKVIALLSTLLIMAPSSVFAGIRDFRPRFARFGAQLVTDYRYLSENQDLDSGGKATQDKKTGSSFRESIRFQNTGYVYHPLLFSFSTNVVGQLTQANIVENGLRSKSKNILEEYFLYGDILKKKLYHADLIVTKRRPLILSDFSDSSPQELSDSEVNVYYDNLPWKVSLNTRFRSNKSETSRSDKENYIFNYLYYDKVGFSLGFGARSDSTKQSRGKIADDSYYFRNVMDYWSSNFNTDANFEVEDSSELKRKAFRFDEHIKTDLPWNFDLSTTLGHGRATVVSYSTGTKDSVQQSENVAADLRQKLFSSLQSTVSAKYKNNASSQGSFKNNEFSFRSVYKKKLRRGTLTGSVTKHITLLDRRGRILVSKEDHEVHVAMADGNPNSTVTLDRLDADMNTVQVAVEIEVVDALGADDCVNSSDSKCRREWLAIYEPDNWSVGPGVSLVNLDLSSVVLLPGSSFIDDGSINPKFSFMATYSTEETDYVMELGSTTFNLGMGLFEDVVKGIYLHSRTSQDLAEGEAAIINLSPSVQRDFFELRYLKEPFDFSVNYRKIESDYQEEKWAVHGGFVKPVKVVSFVTSVLQARYNRIVAETEWENSGRGKEKEYSMYARIDSVIIIPKPGVRLFHSIGYENTVGSVPNFQQNDLGQWALLTSTTTEEEKYFSSLKMNYRFFIPRTKFLVNVRGNWMYEKQVDGDSKIDTGYSLSTGYVWRFGTTSLSINGKYAWERDDSKQVNGLRNIKTTGDTRATLQLARQFL